MYIYLVTTFLREDPLTLPLKFTPISCKPMNCCRMVLLRVTCATENREIIPSHNKSRACGKSPDSFKNWFNPNN